MSGKADKRAHKLLTFKGAHLRDSHLLPLTTLPFGGCLGPAAPLVLLSHQTIIRGGYLHLHLLARAATAACHKRGCLNNRNVFSHRSGGWKSEIHMLGGLVSSGGSEGESIPGLSSSFWWLLTVFGFPWL